MHLGRRLHLLHCQIANFDPLHETEVVSDRAPLTTCLTQPQRLQRDLGNPNGRIQVTITAANDPVVLVVVLVACGMGFWDAGDGGVDLLGIEGASVVRDCGLLCLVESGSGF